MPYKGWNAHAQNVCRQDWVYVDDVWTALKTMQGNLFSKVEGRRAIRDAWREVVNVKMIWDKNNRVPEDVYLLNFVTLDWASKNTQLLEALDFDEGVDDRPDRKVGVTHSKPEDAKGFNKSNAEHAFYQGMRTIKIQLRDEEGLVDREAIEKKLQIEWEEPAVASGAK
jgi:hypothetical protein